MKLKKVRLLTGAAVIGLALAGMTNSVRADLTLFGFDSDYAPATDGGQWPDGSSSKELSWSTEDSEGTESSGSLSSAIHWTTVTGWKDAKVNLPFSWPGVNTPNYVNLQFDVKVVQASSTPAADGSYGLVQVINQGWKDWGLNGTNEYTWQNLGTVQIIATSNWQRVSVSLASAPPTISQIVLNFAGNGSSDPTNTVVYLVDNVVLTSPELAPPTLGLPKPGTSPGLTLIPGTGYQWQRVMVYPNPANLGSDFGWYGKGSPVSYSWTIREFPNAGEFGCNMFLVPNAHMQWGTGDTSTDWNSTNLLSFGITANATTPATNWNVGFGAKTNLGGGNPNLNLLNFNYSQSPTGTWTIRFTDNASFEIIAPNGFSTNGTLPADVAELVSGNSLGNTALTPYFGIMPRSTANVGLPSVFSRIQIQGSGLATNVDDNFSTGLDLTRWSRLADYQPGIFGVTSPILNYLDWNVPNDQGFHSLLASASPNGPYKDIGLDSSKWLLINGRRTAVIYKAAVEAALGSSDAAYFRLVKRAFVKLQILLPGETAAPGTASGKTGTPTAQQAGVPFDVAVRAVDADWFPVSSGDTVSLTSSDPAFTPPTPIALVGGSATFSVTLSTAGSQTLTATDDTDPTKAPNTSSSVTVTP